MFSYARAEVTPRGVFTGRKAGRNVFLQCAVSVYRGKLCDYSLVLGRTEKNRRMNHALRGAKAIYRFCRSGTVDAANALQGDEDPSFANGTTAK